MTSRGDVPKLANLPTEVAQVILSSASDALSLRALAHSNSSLYQAYLGAKPLILRDVLENEFSSSPSTLPDAFAAVNAARLSLKEPNEREEFLSGLNYDTSIPETWSLQHSIALRKLRMEVQFFAKRYASTLTRNPATGTLDENPTQLTNAETARIERAFYRFELYCNLFRDYHNVSLRPSSRRRKEIFFDKFSPWENEQFVCVFEYLSSEVATAFNDVAAHEVEWGERNISVHEWSYIESFLSLGLGFVHRVVEAKTYEERFETLRLELSMDIDFLTHTLNEEDFENADKNVGDLTEEERGVILHPQFFPDPDPGPAEIWFWAYAAYSVGYVYAETDQRFLRKRGYVFFDQARLNEWEVFSKPFENVGDPSEEESIYEDDMNHSYEERDRIWELGGRGYWSEGDESKLVWPYKKGNESVETDNPRFNGPNGFYIYLSYRIEDLARRSWGPYGEYEEENKEK